MVIEPANPQEVYVPVYNPDYVWGAPAYGYYPPLWYPSVGFGFGFGPGIYIGGFFPSWGLFGWGGWGWGCGWWGGRGIYVNNLFFSRYGFRGNGFYNGVGRYAWQHDSFHRAGVPYRNTNVAARFNNSGFAAGRANAAGFNGSRTLGARSFAGNGNIARSFNGASLPRPADSATIQTRIAVRPAELITALPPMAAKPIAETPALLNELSRRPEPTLRLRLPDRLQRHRLPAHFPAAVGAERDPSAEAVVEAEPTSAVVEAAVMSVVVADTAADTVNKPAGAGFSVRSRLLRRLSEVIAKTP